MNQDSIFRPGRWLTALLLAVLATGISAQTLVYEREFTLIGEADNTLRISLSPDDRITVERPAFMTHAGRTEAQAPAGSFARLSGALDGVAPIARTLNQDIQLRSADEYVYVTDPELTRFFLLDSRRQAVEAVEATSIQAWFEHFQDDVRLARLVELENDWYDLMDRVLAGGAK